MENYETYDSFQHELEDYIRKQKARGLQPETCFRKVTEDCAYRDRDHGAPKPLTLEQRLSFRSSHKFSGSCKRLRTMESQLPPGSKTHHSRRRLESLNHCQKNHDHFFKNPWLPSPPVQGKTLGLHAAQHRGGARHLPEGCPSDHPARDQQRRSRGKREGPGNEERAELKRQHSKNGEAYKGKGREAEVEPGSSGKHQHRKKGHRDPDATKEGRGRGREKQPPGKESAQEWDLWDEAILGSCY